MLSIQKKGTNSDRIIHHWKIVHKKEDSLLEAVDLLACIKEIASYSENGSVIFHAQSCISGNGALLAICHFLYQMHKVFQSKKEKIKIKVIPFIIYLRKYFRFGMIQTLEEYRLIYDFLHLLQNELPKPKRRYQEERGEEQAKYYPFNTPMPNRQNRRINREIFK